MWPTSWKIEFIINSPFYFEEYFTELEFSFTSATYRKLWPWRCLLTFLFIANRTSTHYHQDWTTKTNLSAKTNCCFFYPNFLLKATFSANWRVRGKISSRRLRILTKTAANFTSLLELPNGTNIVGWVWKSCFRITKRGQNSAGLPIVWCRIWVDVTT